VGGASEPVRLLLLGALLWCALAPACGTAEIAAGNVSDPGGTPSEGARANSGGDARAGDREVPTNGDEGGAPTAKEPAGSAGGNVAEPSGGGDAGVLLGGGGEANVGGAATSEPPACGKQTDGTLCGPNMTPAGPEGARYFCSSGMVIAEAACPGSCDVETNACVQSGGTGGGTGEANLHTLLRCRACYATQCRLQLTACESDPLCVAHLACFETCSQEDACYKTCRGAFKGERLFDELDTCVEATGCFAHCPRE